jgi:hypothetical protein
MGYESKIIVAERSTSSYGEKGCIYCEVVSIFNLCKASFITNAFKKPEKPVEIYFDGDGDAPISEDCYGDQLTVASVADVIKVLKKEISKNSYRRLKPLLGMLEGFNVEEWNDLICIHYGY